MTGRTGLLIAIFGLMAMAGIIIYARVWKNRKRDNGSQQRVAGEQVSVTVVDPADGVETVVSPLGESSLGPDNATMETRVRDVVSGSQQKSGMTPTHMVYQVYDSSGNKIKAGTFRTYPYVI